MTNSHLPAPVDLTDAELDFVTGGQAQGGAVAAGGLVNVALGAVNVDILRNANIDVIDDVTVTIQDVANNNNVSVGAIVQLLGGGAAILQRQV